MTDPTTERRHPGSGHPDLETLADLDAGVLDDTSGLRSHLDSCAACTDLVGQLQDTRALLAGLPAPALPAVVAERLDAAVRTASAGPGVTVLRIRPDRARHASAPPRWRHPGAVAASIVLVLGALTGIGALISQVGGAAAPSKATSGALRDTAAPPRLPVTASGRDYGPATLDGGVRALLSARRVAAAQVPRSASAPAVTPDVEPYSGREVSPALARLSGPPALQACVDELAGRGGAAAITVDLARYRGRPAAIVVLADPDPAKVDAWIVGGGCRRGQPDLVRYQVVRRAG